MKNGGGGTKGNSPNNFDGGDKKAAFQFVLPAIERDM